MQVPAVVLLFGEDDRLVETRGWVLEKAGFEVRTALTIIDLDRIATQEEIDLFLLCDSLHPEACIQCVALIRSRWPLTRRLIIEPVIISAELDPRESILSAMEGPRGLITAIHKLLANDPSMIA
jgi:DNA-binding response OmpR family regulator